MKVVLAIVILIGGLFIWAMMQFTDLGYNWMGILLSFLAISLSVMVVSDGKV